MAQLFDRIRQAVSEGRYAIGVHAGHRLHSRRIMGWQVAAGLAEGRLLAEIPESKPNPKVEVEQVLPDGTRIKAVWSWLAYNGTAKLVTVHYFDR